MSNLISLMLISIAYYVGYKIGKRNGKVEYAEQVAKAALKKLRERINK